MSRNALNNALRIMRRIEDKPALQKVIEEKGIKAVRSVAAITTQKTEEFLGAKGARDKQKYLEGLHKRVSSFALY